MAADDPNISIPYCCMPLLPPTSIRVVTMPGTSPAMTHGFRPVGTASSNSCSMLVCTVALRTSTTGASPVTVTVSSTPEIPIEAFTSRVRATLSRTPSCTTVWNPERAKLTLYSPGGRAGWLYEPPAPVVVLRGAISAGLLTVTVTPGRTAPCSSVAVPVIVPVCWANAGTAASIASATRIAVLRMKNLLTRRGSKDRVRAAVGPRRECAVAGRRRPVRARPRAQFGRKKRKGQFDARYHASPIPD